MERGDPVGDDGNGGRVAESDILGWTHVLACCSNTLVAPQWVAGECVANLAWGLGLSGQNVGFSVQEGSMSWIIHRARRHH